MNIQRAFNSLLQSASTGAAALQGIKQAKKIAVAQQEQAQALQERENAREELNAKVQNARAAEHEARAFKIRAEGRAINARTRAEKAALQASQDRMAQVAGIRTGVKERKTLLTKGDTKDGEQQ